jgi:hypothetical protein
LYIFYTYVVPHLKALALCHDVGPTPEQDIFNEKFPKTKVKVTAENLVSRFCPNLADQTYKLRDRQGPESSEFSTYHQILN